MHEYIINHVMSREIDSGIFSAILGYFRRHSPVWVRHVESVKPLMEADVYHYHRPHLESSLKENSVCTVHHDLDDPDIWHSRRNFIPRYIESEKIVCLNSRQKKILLVEEGFSSEKVYIVPHGYNESVLSPIKKERVAGEKFTLGVASRRYGRRVKGEAYLSELVKRLDPTKIRFILVGQDRGIDAIYLRRLGFDVDVFERLPYRAFQGFYKEIDALLMCSGHEGGPANIPEALATGTPVFTTPVGMSLDFVNDDANGVFLTTDPDSDAEIIHRYVLDPTRFEGIENRCFEGSGKVPTWKDSVIGNLNVYSDIIGSDICVDQEPEDSKLKEDVGFPLENVEVVVNE